MTDGIITKFCGKCRETLPTSEFHKNKRRHDGLASQCKTCRKAYSEANREKQAEYDKARYLANREELKEQSRVYKKENPEVARAADRRRRARKRNAEGDHTAAQIRARSAAHGDACIYCASQSDLHIDHIKPLAKGGSNWPSNLAPACATCNVSKRDKWGEDLLRWIEQNCTVESTKKIFEKVLHNPE